MGVGWELPLSTTRMFYIICWISPDSAYLISGFIQIFPDFSGIGPIFAFVGFRIFPDFSGIGPFLGFRIFPDPEM